MRDGPALVRPAGAGVEDDQPIPRLEAGARQKLGDARLGHSVGRQRELDRVRAHPKRLHERKIPVHDVPRRCRRRHAVIREERARGFATVRRHETDPERRPCRGGDHATLDQPLKIDRHVEPSSAQVTSERDQRAGRLRDRGHGAHATPTSRVDRDDLAQCGVAAQHRRLAALDDPGQARLGKAGAQRRGHG